MTVRHGLPDADVAALLQEQLPALRAFAIALSRDASIADDLVQDTLMRAWSRFDLFTPGTSLKAWLFTILRNAYYSNLRQQRLRRRLLAEDGQRTVSSQKPDHDGRIALSEFLAALQHLQPQQREALILVGACGFSIEEAARMTGVAEGTVKSRVSRARLRLCALLHLMPGELPLTEDGGVLPAGPDRPTRAA